MQPNATSTEGGDIDATGNACDSTTHKAPKPRQSRQSAANTSDSDFGADDAEVNVDVARRSGDLGSRWQQSSPWLALHDSGFALRTLATLSLPAAKTLAGAVTPFCAAQASFCSRLKQQHSFQQEAASRQPHGRSWQGKGTERSFSTWRQIGTPMNAAPSAQKTAAAMNSFIARKASFDLKDFVSKAKPRTVHLRGLAHSSHQRC